MEYIAGTIQKVADATTLRLVQAVEIDRDGNPLLELDNCRSHVIITAWTMDANLEFCNLRRMDGQRRTAVSHRGCTVR